MYYIYSLKCKNGFYIGCTDDIQERLDRHQKGQVPATAGRLPVNLEFYFAIEDKYKAFEIWFRSSIYQKALAIKSDKM